MKKRVIAVGFFDGVHIGHSALMTKMHDVATKNSYTSTVFTFDKHPNSVVFNQKMSFLFCFKRRRDQILLHSGADEVILWDFSPQNAQMPWNEFVKDVLVGDLNAGHIITGIDFKFGHKGLGNSQNLAQLCAEIGVGYDAIEQVIVDGVRVSSTQIRELVKNGEIAYANRLLGHPYAICGSVEHGRKQGRLLGFPTINLSMPQDMQVPAFGVYVSRVTFDGISHMAVTNVGTVPTFCDDNSIKIESYILDYSGDLYDKLVTVEFLDFLRPEQKFNSIDEIKAMIEKNANQTREYFANN